ncbi:GTP cyclohydrolase II [Dongia mobilis]|uniref:GTP cyclohydrolase-2 n=2 Tax=Dongia mobilis TaxID=578943 RepID=A0A4R6X2K7_9PROT|nr:GTP cyclohydrolase II [Dongia mobilis]
MAELRRGGIVALLDGQQMDGQQMDGQQPAHRHAALVIAAEMLEQPALATLLAANNAGQGGTGRGIRLVVTAERANALVRRGLVPAPAAATAADDSHRLLALSGALAAEAIRQIADPTVEPVAWLAAGIVPVADVAPALCQGAIELTKLARLLPAALIVLVPHSALERWVDPAFRLEAADLPAFRRNAAANLRRVGSAPVPLDGAESCEIVAFRPSDGGKEHLAIVIGRPDTSQPVLVRLHSECYTGDLLGSLRCDCGPQLRGAIAAIEKAGSGVLLYLAQEGRGIGLVNKLRAYRLQDAGADTLDANLQLGYGADERLYEPAAEMLRQLGVGAVRLLTNNPEKVAGLAQCGIAVIERVPHVFQANDHNERYLSTKAIRFGHMF